MASPKSISLKYCFVSFMLSFFISCVWKQTIFSGLMSLWMTPILDKNFTVEAASVKNLFLLYFLSGELFCSSKRSQSPFSVNIISSSGCEITSYNFITPSVLEERYLRMVISLQRFVNFK